MVAICLIFAANTMIQLWNKLARMCCYRSHFFAVVALQNNNMKHREKKYITNHFSLTRNRNTKDITSETHAYHADT